MTDANTSKRATFVSARNVFREDNRDAHIGTWAFGFSWGAWAALLIATLLFCIGTRGDKHRRRGGSRFRRKKSTRSARSYDMGGRRVKGDYS